MYKYIVIITPSLLFHLILQNGRISSLPDLNLMKYVHIHVKEAISSSSFIGLTFELRKNPNKFLELLEKMIQHSITFVFRHSNSKIRRNNFCKSKVN